MRLFALNCQTFALVVAAPSLQHAREIAGRWSHRTGRGEPVAWHGRNVEHVALGMTDGEPGVRVAWTSPVPVERIHRYDGFYN